MCERLFQINVLAQPHGGRCDNRVRVIGNSDGDRINVVADFIN